MDSQTFLIPLIVIAFLVIFPVFWSLVCWLISRFGWASLAARHPAAGPIVGRHFHWCSGRIGLIGANYNGCLNLIAGREGLHLSVMAIFRPGHRPILLPWDSLTEVGEINILGFKRVRLRLESGGTSLTVYLPAGARELLEELKAAA